MFLSIFYCEIQCHNSHRNANDAEILAKKALQASKINKKNTAVRSKIKEPPEKKTGVAEPFGDGEGSLLADSVLNIA